MTLSIPEETAFSFNNTLFSKFRMINEMTGLNKDSVFKNNIKDEQQRETTVVKGTSTEEIERPKRAGGLVSPYNYNKKENSAECLKEYANGLEKMVLMTHHKVRQPVTDILAMANLLEYANSPDTIKTVVEYLKRSASDLDTFTRELTAAVNDLKQKGKE